MAEANSGFGEFRSFFDPLASYAQEAAFELDFICTGCDGNDRDGGYGEKNDLVDDYSEEETEPGEHDDYSYYNNEDTMMQIRAMASMVSATDEKAHKLIEANRAKEEPAIETVPVEEEIMYVEEEEIFTKGLTLAEMMANYDQDKKEAEDEVEKVDEEVDDQVDDNANETVSTASSLGTHDSNNVEVEISNVFSSKIKRGYSMTETNCGKCDMPLIEKPGGGRLECAVCPVLSRIDGGGRHGATTNVISDKIEQGYTLTEIRCRDCDVPMVEQPGGGALECAVCPHLSKGNQAGSAFMKTGQRSQSSKNKRPTSPPSVITTNTQNKPAYRVVTDITERKKTTRDITERKQTTRGITERKQGAKDMTKRKNENEVSWTTTAVDDTTIATPVKRILKDTTATSPRSVTATGAEDKGGHRSITERKDANRVSWATSTLDFTTNAKGVRKQSNKNNESHKPDPKVKRRHNVLMMELLLETKGRGDDDDDDSDCPTPPIQMPRIDVQVEQRDAKAEEISETIKESPYDWKQGLVRSFSDIATPSEEIQAEELPASNALAAQSVAETDETYVDESTDDTKWSMIMEFCKGERCKKSLLLGRNKERKCAICNGTGTGKDGIYAIMANGVPNELKVESPSFSPPSDINPTIVAQEAVSSLWHEVASSLNMNEKNEEYKDEQEVEDSNRRRVEEVVEKMKLEVVRRAEIIAAEERESKMARHFAEKQRFASISKEYSHQQQPVESIAAVTPLSTAEDGVVKSKVEDVVADNKTKDVMFENKAEDVVVGNKLENVVVGNKLGNMMVGNEAEGMVIVENQVKDATTENKVDDVMAENKFEDVVVKNKIEDSVVENSIEKVVIENKVEVGVVESKVEVGVVENMGTDMVVENEVEEDDLFSLESNEAEVELGIDAIESEREHLEDILVDSIEKERMHIVGEEENDPIINILHNAEKEEGDNNTDLIIEILNAKNATKVNAPQKLTNISKKLSSMKTTRLLARKQQFSTIKKNAEINIQREADNARVKAKAAEEIVKQERSRRAAEREAKVLMKASKVVKKKGKNMTDVVAEFEKRLAMM